MKPTKVAESETMAENTAVNGQITDAVTQTNVKVVAEASAMAMGTLYQLGAHSLGLGMENAVTAQQQATILAQATTSQCVAQLFGKSDRSANGK